MGAVDWIGEIDLCPVVLYCSMNNMSSLQEIKAAIAQLSPAEFAALRTWFGEYDAARWDRPFEDDVAAGRLDKLSEQALKTHSI